ncbi:MAG TPA: carbamoyl-phosphate synthase large subunit [Actinomycetota bacterium]|nr:carbamoyl-phosphate synthase large subunit [Actinomycetota bacterium]
MPRRTDIESILIVGSGPIVIGQACEFDYSGTQACRVLRADGFRVILVNSNPATIMTDPEFADRTYVEPITAESVARVIERERPQALLPTLGGQTALNVAVELAEQGVLEKFNVELIGARLEAIRRGEDRRLFKECMQEAGIDLPRSGWAYSLDEARALAEEIGYPLIVRPSYMLGGAGSGFAFDEAGLDRIAGEGLARSRIGEVLIEESVLGWKEFELEVMRDLADNVVIICSIENVDPMGVHTGDSITVAPQQTLTDVEYQEMRDAAIRCIRAIGVDTGGSNIQFAVDPKTGRQVIIEMNPRVSRSSALASKATGFPIAKIAAKLAVGYRLDEIPNDITKQTLASFEPTIDYVVTKIPRFAFEKFPGADPTLTSAMKSVGEAMGVGRTFKESLQKAIRSLEQDRAGLNGDGKDPVGSPSELLARSARPTPDRIFAVEAALRGGVPVATVAEKTGIDPWFLAQISEISRLRRRLEGSTLSEGVVRSVKRMGFSDAQIGQLCRVTEEEVRGLRAAWGVRPVFKSVDTCAAEFEAQTPYFYSTYEEESEIPAERKPTIIILGAGPNRIGQGIEFDYCCVHACFALRDAGYDVVMVNCNPETVSTDYDTSDRLYVEPLTFEDVMEIVDAEQPIGVMVQLGGQTPLKLARALEAAGVTILGTAPDAIDIAEDRGRFGRLLAEMDLPHAPWGIATSFEEAKEAAARIGYPVLVRPSYVLGGRAMEIVYDDAMLARYIETAAQVSPAHPILIDRFLEDAIEVDVDALCDGTDVYIGGVMEHIEEAGIHSGDSACVIPPHTLSRAQIAEIAGATQKMALALGVRGLLNVQYAVRAGQIYVLEANPRASRTVPFVSKATGVQLAKAAARVQAGESLAALREAGIIPAGDMPPKTDHVAVKEAVLPFSRFPGVDTLLGPEMKSTGEVMGIDRSFGMAFAKAEEAADARLPRTGNLFVSVRDSDKRAVVLPVRRLADLGFEIYATSGTAELLSRNGISVHTVPKIGEGSPHVGDLMEAGKIDLIINTPSGWGPRKDGDYIRTSAVRFGVPSITTLAGLQAAVQGIDEIEHSEPTVLSLQEYHGR